jgi:hypothetical protein
MMLGYEKEKNRNNVVGLIRKRGYGWNGGLRKSYKFIKNRRV